MITIVTTSTLVFGLITALPATGTGSNTNQITPESPPRAGSVGGFFDATAYATSKDPVIVTVDSLSTGCSVVKGKVVFTSAGECIIDYNDPGNASYSVAPTVTESIKVYPSNVISVSSRPTAASVDGVYSPDASATSGDAVRVTLAKGSTGCIVVSGRVEFNHQGTCRVSFSDPGNGAFAPAQGFTQVITVYALNFIHASQPPTLGVLNATYTASATVSSGDPVQITLDPSSSGCQISGDVVTFTGDGICVLDFNDPGNGPFAPATQVQQRIASGVPIPVPQAPLYLTSLNATLGRTLVLTSQGGSGSGAVTYAATPGSADCSISVGINVLSYGSVGTCVVTVSKAGDVAYEAAKSAPTIVTVNLARSPHALRFVGTTIAGRTVLATIVGTGFYGLPRIRSNAAGTTAVVTSDTGEQLHLRVSVARGTPSGLHTFTLVFAHGQRTLVLYPQR
ncbi:MAG: hypothetical protein WAN30_06960 [Acidimicrobiales bacterium]